MMQAYMKRMIFYYLLPWVFICMVAVGLLGALVLFMRLM